jgi:hypothetical protein
MVLLSTRKFASVFVSRGFTRWTLSAPCHISEKRGTRGQDNTVTPHAFLLGKRGRREVVGLKDRRSSRPIQRPQGAQRVNYPPRRFP